MWFHTWSDLLRVLLVGMAAYVTLVAVLRVSGKRTLSKMNAFDFVVTIAFGSVLASLLLSASVSWAEGAVALALLASLPYAVARLTVALPGVRRAVTAEPAVVLRDGHLDRDASRRHRVVEDEVLQAVRGTGTGDLREVAAVVLETDGIFSVISRARLGDASALGDLDVTR